MQSQCYVELETFNDLARYACAFREYPLRVFTHEFDGRNVISSGMILANTLVLFYVDLPKSGRYVSYNISSGKEFCDIVYTTKDISTYSPIIHYESEPSPLPTKIEYIDKFHPVKVKDLGSLARLTYDPEFPDEQKLTLYLVPHNGSWILGYITSLEMDTIYYQFNYVELDSKPTKPFVKFRANEDQEPEFSDSFGHGFSYLPIIHVKDDHPIFGLQ